MRPHMEGAALAGAAPGTSTPNVDGQDSPAWPRLPALPLTGGSAGALIDALPAEARERLRAVNLPAERAAFRAFGRSLRAVARDGGDVRMLRDFLDAWQRAIGLAEVAQWRAP